MSDFETRFYDLQHRTKNDTLSLKWMNEYALRELSDEKIRYFLMSNVLRSDASQALHDLLIINDDLKSSLVAPAVAEIGMRYKNTLSMHEIDFNLNSSIDETLEVKSKMLFYLSTVLAELTTMLIYKPVQSEVDVQVNLTCNTEDTHAELEFSSEIIPELPDLPSGFGEHLLDLMIRRQMRGSYEFHTKERFSLTATLPLNHLKLK